MLCRRSCRNQSSPLLGRFGDFHHFIDRFLDDLIIAFGFVGVLPPQCLARRDPHIERDMLHARSHAGHCQPAIVPELNRDAVDIAVVHLDANDGMPPALQKFLKLKAIVEQSAKFDPGRLNGEFFYPYAKYSS